MNDLKAIASITINRVRTSNRWNRKTNKCDTKVYRSSFTGVVMEAKKDGSFDMLVAGPKGGIVLVTVEVDGRYDWRSFYALNGKRTFGNVADWDFEISAVEMGDLNSDEIDMILSGSK